MKKQRISLVGAPIELGAGVRGCLMGPEALRLAGIGDMLSSLGHEVEDRGDVVPAQGIEHKLAGRANHATNVTSWTRALEAASYAVLRDGRLPIFLGGDHALAMGTVAGAARFAHDRGQPLCVLWLDAHADFNTPATSESGNMHGMPVAFYCGEPGFEDVLPNGRPLVAPDHVFMIGIRSVDDRERELLAERGINVFDMRAIDEFGIAAILRSILEQVERMGAMLHVSLDVDFLDPAIAPGVGTTVAGGANFREAHLIMEMLSESGLTTSMDIAELNPFLDERGKSAHLLADLTASLFGRRILDKVATLASNGHGYMAA
ncbi:MULTISPECIES: arginase [unclassified Sphingomonas]|uniref:arginase n=1 Tax=unclassified Sphingomonas TaxID=196159 RepID=UPI0006F8CCD7|nr:MULTISPECIES: arginase [unclassified Sphingomonas]KQX25967.1 arginase [Sphingomonas sp. Root1294]KQY69032.1 arginase [Sphingomonas sp. Root50]KRB89287.1 arginase [Sphingomonas sp. Root720]